MKYTNLEAVMARVSAQISEIEREKIPPILAEKATVFFKETFKKKGWDGIPWQPAKHPPNYGSLMLRSHHLQDSIRPTEITPERIVITAGNSKVQYARIHNEGGTIQLHARSETFTRNRFSKGKNKGRFSGGTKAGRGFTHKAAEIQMPQRQFMGDSPLLEKQLIQDILTAFKPILK